MPSSSENFYYQQTEKDYVILKVKLLFYGEDLYY